MRDENVSQSSDHLCVLVHGLWGVPAHLNNVVKALRQKHSEEALHILVSKSNIGTLTYDGIDVCGERLCQEIEAKLHDLERSDYKINKLSIVSYSMGGLVARYAVGLLFSRGIFEHATPINFITMATPHLGARTPREGWLCYGWNFFGGIVISRTGQQIFAFDNFRGTNRRLLAVMTDRRSVFIEGLARFKHKVLYANIINDYNVMYYTSSISKTDPFHELDKLCLNYLNGYGNVLLDSTGVTTAIPDNVTVEGFNPAHIVYWALTFVQRLSYHIFMAGFLSFAAVLFLVYSAVQVVLSRRRIKMHEGGQAVIVSELYRRGLQEYGEEIQAVHALANGEQHQYQAHKVGTQGIRRRQRTKPLDLGETRTNSERKMPRTLSIQSIGKLSDESLRGLEEHQESPLLGYPALNLQIDQFDMLKALDELGWKKYLVHIHKTRFSHRAIIVRENWKRFDEGFIVLGHLAERFSLR